jgi:hypothetical protein
MKKTIRLTLLAAAAALVLTSCDAMLEDLFPSETGHGTVTGSNTLTFHVQGHDAYYNGSYVDQYGGYYYYYGGYPAYWGDYYNYYPATNANYDVYVSLYDQSGNLVETDFAPFTGGGGPVARTIDLSITGLPDGSYYYDVWYDLNGNGLLDVETSYPNTYYESV